MTAVKRDLYIEQGATFVMPFQWCGQGPEVDGQVTPGAPKDLTGWTVRMQVRKNQGDPALITATTTNGKVVLGGDPSTVATALIAPPVQANATAATTGGTLAAGTYYYVITALDVNGETAASNEKSITTTGATSVVTLNWAAVTGATGYNIYRSSTVSGAEVFLKTVGAVTTTTNTGSTTPGTKVPPTALDPKNGWITVTLTDDDTDLLIFKSAKYDLEAENPAGRVFRLLQGAVAVDPNITQEADDPVVGA